MSEIEFDEVAANTARRFDGAGFMDRVVASCRGSGNPAALAWLGDGLRLDELTNVLDLGAGLGGAAAWLAHRYRCTIVALEPAEGAASGCRSLFGLPVVRAGASAVPFRSGSFDVALVLGVASVVAQPRRLFSEAARVADRLGCLEYVASGTRVVNAGGSTFPARRALRRWLQEAGWHISFDTPLHMSAPGPWSDDDAPGAVDVHVDPVAEASEAEVVAAIRAGVIEPHVYIAGK